MGSTIKELDYEYPSYCGHVTDGPYLYIVFPDVWIQHSRYRIKSNTSRAARRFSNGGYDLVRQITQ